MRAIKYTILFFIWFALLVASALGLDYLLHVVGEVWIGRYLGIVGLIFILASLLPYSLRKRQLLRSLEPQPLLRAHQAFGWAGGVLVVVHAGVHANAILPWLALFAMLAAVGSGLISVFVLRQTRKQLESARSSLVALRLTPAEIDQQLFWDAFAVGLLQNWRVIHQRAALAFAVLTTCHVVGVLMFWGWR